LPFASRPCVKFAIRKNDAALSPRKIFGETAPRTPRAHTTRAEFQKSDLVTFVTGLSGRMMQVRRLPGSSVMRRG
jgi:nucleoside diphosphate kinase